MNKVPLRISVLHYITDYGLEGYRLSVTGFFIPPEFPPLPLQKLLPLLCR